MKHLDHLILRDGRRLAFAEFGDPAGIPVLYFHGSPSSRLEPMLVGDGQWRRLGLRIIAPDRPGIGESSFQVDRSIADWPEDVAALAGHLRFERFAVLGNSGGAPYAAACAVRIPQRITRIAIVSGGWRMDWPEARHNLPVPNRIFLGLAAHAPPLLRLALKSMTASMGNSEEPFHRCLVECVKPGTRGVAWDLRLYMRDFGFGLGDVKMPIGLFHGDRDTNAPMAMVRRIMRDMPAATLVTYPGEDHLSTLCNRIDDVARSLKT